MSAPPPHFTQEFYTPDHLRDAWRAWTDRHTHFDSIQRSHMWHQIGLGGYVQLGVHSIEVFDAELRPGFLPGGGYTDPRTICHGPGDLLYQAICEPCRWHTFGTEPEVVEAWHDHAAPGWRHLPVIPAEVRDGIQMGKPNKAAMAWIEEHYPSEWQQPGHPILTKRERPGTRHVAGYSPWGGYDLSDTALSLDHHATNEQLVLF